jgi:uncharacterized protein
MRTSLLALLLFPLCVAASQLPDFPFVYVFGSAHRDIAPDSATISFRIKTYAEAAAPAYQKQSELAGAVLTVTEKLGIPPQDVSAESIEKSAVRRRDDRGTSYDIVGYEATRSVDIRVNDLKRFPDLIEFLYGSSNIEGIRAYFWRKDGSAILQELTNEAATAAREKGERLCRSFQRKLGVAFAISEEGYSGIGRPFGLGDSGSTTQYSPDFVSGSRDFRVIPATIALTSSVYAIFKTD